jgi:Glycosyl transferases group 1
MIAGSALPHPMQCVRISAVRRRAVIWHAGCAGRTALDMGDIRLARTILRANATTQGRGHLDTLRVGFALLTSASNPAPSTRIACLNLFPFLPALGIEPVVLFEQPEAIAEPDLAGTVERAVRERCDVVVFQKIHGPGVLRCVQGLREHGIASVYVVCDFVDDAMASAVDRTVVVTAFLRSLYAPALQERIDVVHDGIERPELFKPAGLLRPEGPLRAAMVTSHEVYALPVIGAPPAPWHVQVLGQYPRDPAQRRRALRWALTETPGLAPRWRIVKAALHPRLERTAWTPDGVYVALLAADIGIIPVDTSQTWLPPTAPVPSWQLKSENRLTLKMALGLPVIATPIPAYERVLDHGTNGFLARSRADWMQCFGSLRDPDLRAEMGRKARQSVLEPFSVVCQAEKFARVVRRVVSSMDDSVGSSADLREGVNLG